MWRRAVCARRFRGVSPAILEREQRRVGGVKDVDRVVVGAALATAVHDKVHVHVRLEGRRGSKCGVGE